MRNKCLELEIALNEIKNELGYEIDAICVCEHHLCEQEVNLILLNNYYIPAFYCRKIITKGGVLIFIRNTLHFQAIQCKTAAIEKHFEYTAIKNSKTIVISVYRTPDGDFSLFIDSLAELLTELSILGLDIMLCGDFNINLHVNSKNKTEFLATTAAFNLKPLIRTSTRITKHSATLIDNIFINITGMNIVSKVLEMGLSDHSQQLIIVNDYFSEFTSSSKEERRCFNKKSLNKFQGIVSSADWSSVYNVTNVEKKMEAFYEVFLTCFEAAFPPYLAERDRCSQKSWITKGIKKSCKTKRELLKYKKYSNDIHFHNYVKNYEKILKHTIILAKQLYIRNRLSQSTNISKTTWDIIKEETGKSTHRKGDNLKLEYQNNNIVNPTDVANTFNDYFINVALNLTDNLQTKYNSNYYLNKTGFDVSSSFFISPVEVKEVEKVIDSLKNKKSFGSDNIPVCALKCVIQHIATPITNIVNASFESGVFPSKLKISVVKPLYKKGSKLDAANYRPISLLPTISKFFEKLMYIRLENYFASKHYLNTCQFGVKKDSNTTLAIDTFLEQIVKSIENNEYIVGIFCDLSKAFDCIDHDILLNKLYYYGIREKQSKWFQSYLSQRKQIVEVRHQNTAGVIKAYASEQKTVRCGVPQGSILGPLLFIIYINDLPFCTKECNYTLFADDTNLLIKTTSKQDMLNITPNILNTICQWFTDNKLLLNYEKSVNITFTSPKTNDNNNFTTINGSIEAVESTKFLGVCIDNKLTWSPHINYLIGKLTGIVFALSVIRKRVDLETSKIVYFSYFESLLSYGIEFWGNCKDNFIIFKIQKRAIRAMCKLNRYDSCRNYFTSLRIFTLANLFIFKTMQSIFNKRAKLLKSCDVHYHYTRQNSNLRLPHATKTTTQNSLLYTGIKLYNLLPDNIKDTNNINSFKSRLRKWLHENTFYNIQEYIDLLS